MSGQAWHLDEWLREGRLAGHRSLLVLSGNGSSAIRYANALISGLAGGSTLWISNRGGLAGAVVSDPNPAQLVGMELDVVAIDGWAGFDADVLGAVGGTVKGGGLLVLCVPPLGAWADFDDPAGGRFRTYPGGPGAVGRRYIRRMASLLAGDSRARVVDPDSIALPARSFPVPIEPHMPGSMNEGQREAVDAICHVVTGQRRRPVVLTADRGRGKSAALGMAAARLARQGVRSIVITAVRRGAADVVFRHVDETLADSASCDTRIEYVSPWRLVEGDLAPDLVLVDEAAALPLAWHESALKRFSRIAFATTVHGYEGSGRGFAMRFNRLLDRHSRGWREVCLSRPVRWADGDPVEGLLFDALLLDAEIGCLETGGEIDSASLVIERIDRDRLVADETMLRQFFGMLVQSHYRTRPNDLRYMLDAPDLELLTARAESLLVGAVVVAREGDFEPEVAQRVWEGRSRPRGHMLAETLSAQLGEATGPLLKGRRVVRLAVHPALRRRGIGTRLVNRLLDAAREQSADYVGCSFAVGIDVAAFWERAGFQPVWLGGKRAASSGVRSMVMLAPLTPRARELTARCRERFLENLSLRLSSLYADEDPAHIAVLFAGAPVDPLSKRDIEEVTRFANGCANFESSFPGIWRAARLLLSRFPSGDGYEEARRLLVSFILQQKRPGEASADLRPVGRKEMIESLRALFRCALEQGLLVGDG